MGDFTSRDIQLLEKHFQVRSEYYKGLKHLPSILTKILKGVLWSDVTFSNFADNHALITVILSTLFKRKSIVLIGGYEVARVFEFKYGLNRSPFYPLTVRMVFRLADQVIAVSSHLKKEAISNLRVRESKISVIPNGFDSQLFQPHGQKERLVMSAAICRSLTTVRLKGIDILFQAAERIPQIHFAVIGIHEKIKKELEAQAPANVSLIPSVSQERLVSYYQRSKVYCQLSLREGHPNALCEAMLCECVPVVSEAPGNTTVVGKTGFYVPYGDPQKTAEAIQAAFHVNLGPEARTRIANLFPLEKREFALCKIIQDFI